MENPDLQENDFALIVRPSLEQELAKQNWRHLKVFIL